MYALKVLKELNHPDGRIFLPGHDCNALSLFEACGLLYEYPENFEPANELTADVAKDRERVKHYAESYLRAAEDDES